MAMNNQETRTKAPGISVTERDKSDYSGNGEYKSPVCLVFGFAPKGPFLEANYITSLSQLKSTFGRPEDSLEKYFYNAAVRVIKSGGTALMTRLPYDNAQANTVKYVRYSVEQPIHRQYVYADGDVSEEKYRAVDNDGIDVLNIMHELDDHLNGYSRIKCASESVESMSVDKFDEVMLDSSDLHQDSIYIFDIMKQQLGTNPLLTKPDTEYLGIVPVLVPTSTALYVQEKIENNSENDLLFNLLSIPVVHDSEGAIVGIDPKGIVTDAEWKTEESEETVQTILHDILDDFSQVLDFNHTGTFYDKKSVSDVAALKYPLVRYNSPEHLESRYFDQLGVVVFELVFNRDTDKVDIIPRESFCGYISNCDSDHPPIENSINFQSKYIRIIRKVRNSPYRDFFHISNQPLVVMGMKKQEVVKKINYKKCIEEPISYMLDAWYSDVDGTHIDLILDAGITTVAHHAWKRTVLEGEDSVFYFNPTLEEVFVPDTAKPSMATLKELEYCSTAWHKLTKMFTTFIESKRGDCLFIADGPRCLNLDRNIPLLQRYPNVTNSDILNRYLRYFEGKSTSYGTRIFNWVMATDESTDLSIWMPPSILAAQIYANSERYSFPWYAPAGVTRGRVPDGVSITLRTKPYSGDNDLLYSNQWNFFTQNINVGVLLEGNKTMQKETTALDRVNVRRLCNYIKRQVRDISNRYKYEPNTEGLRMQFSDEISGMLSEIKSNAGVTDFIVICNGTNNTNETIERNELHCKIAIKPVKAIEYIMIDFVILKQSVNFIESNVTAR